MSKNCKLGVLKGLIHRAHQLCDLKEDLLCELQLLRDVFLSNGYPQKLVERTINNSWKVELKKEIYASLHEEDILHQNEEEENPGYFETSSLHYWIF